MPDKETTVVLRDSVEKSISKWVGQYQSEEGSQPVVLESAIPVAYPVGISVNVEFGVGM